MGATLDSQRAVAPLSNAAAANAAAASFAALTDRLDYLNPTEIEELRSAYRFADEAHLGQLRRNGEPYITHPIAVAQQCALWKLDVQALMAALLHDSIEDCGVTKLELVERFGAPVAELVDGLTKLDKLQFNTREENQAESFRKMLLAMARDVRVILLKLADRMHNMRTLGDVPPQKWPRIAKETQEIYAPIAYRLGLNQAYHELQDLSFRYLMPWRYAVLSKAVGRARSRRRDLMQKVQTEVEAIFAQSGIPMRMMGREKSLYSIFRKMQSKHLSFAQVTDIYGFRVIISNVLQCYTAIGLLHQLYKPVPGKFKDHIAIAKLNGYQSLHTTLIGPSGLNIEFQTRTQEMDIVAESGVAAHWLYKASDGVENQEIDTADRLGSKWLQSLLEIQDETRDAAEFWDHVRVDLFPDAVYVFTPKGQIMGLPRGATIVDFAYAVHTNVGDTTIAAKVNGEQVPLRTELRNGDVVEVITHPDAKPNPTWLGFIRTGRARSKVRHYLKTMAYSESQALGEKLLQQALRAEGVDLVPDDDVAHHALWEKLLRFTGNQDRAELLTDLGLGKRVATIVAKRLAKLMQQEGEKPDLLALSKEKYNAHEAVTQGAIVLDGSENASVQYASCCCPIPGDEVVGYLGRGEGLTVHLKDCNVAQRLQYKDSERFITVEWSEDRVRDFETRLLVTVLNGKGVLAHVATAMARAHANITHIDMDEMLTQDTIDLRFTISVEDLNHLESVLRVLRRTPSVLSAARLVTRK